MKKVFCYKSRGRRLNPIRSLKSDCGDIVDSILIKVAIHDHFARAYSVKNSLGLKGTSVESMEEVQVMAELLKRGVASIGDISCPMCKQFPESISHLFLLVRESSCLPVGPVDFLEAWGEICEANDNGGYLSPS
ncbi:hypothetical protein GQ457_06G015000 [Hibiscus cannabinus]